MKFAVFIFLVLETVSLFNVVSGKMCKEPADLKKVKSDIYELIRTDNLLGKATYSVIPEMKTHVLNTVNGGRRPLRKQFETRISGPPKCKAGADAKSNTLSDRATCRWYYYMDVDTEREPKIMIKARCACAKCKHGQGTCQPVSTLVPVIRRQCDKEAGVYVYYPYMEDVPRGCTCMRNKTG